MALPTRVRRATAISSTANATSWEPAFTWVDNTAISAGNMVRWLVMVASDGAPTLAPSAAAAAAGWTLQDQHNEATGQVSYARFVCETTTAFAAGAMPAFGITSSTSEQFTAILLAYQASAPGNTIEALTGGYLSGAGTAASVAALTNTTGADIDVQFIALCTVDGSNNATNFPSGYANLLTRNGNSANAAQRAAAKDTEGFAAGAVEAPTDFPLAINEWVTILLGWYESSGTTPPPATRRKPRNVTWF